MTMAGAPAAAWAATGRRMPLRFSSSSTRTAAGVAVEAWETTTARRRSKLAAEASKPAARAVDANLIMGVGLGSLFGFELESGSGGGDPGDNHGTTKIEVRGGGEQAGGGGYGSDHGRWIRFHFLISSCVPSSRS